MNLTLFTSERNRTRAGLVILLVGVLMLIYVWSSWLYRSALPVPPAVGVNATASVADGDASARTAAVRRAVPLFVAVASLLLVAFVIAVYLLLRGGRLLRGAQRHAPERVASVYQDAWTMHKLPEQSEEEPGDEDG